VATVNPLQSNFSSGVLDPRLASRIDLQQYYNGLKSASNIRLLIQGGFSRRPGTRMLAELPATGVLEPFQFNTDQRYLIALSEETLRIYKDGVLQATKTGSGQGAPWTAAEARTLGFTQSADTMFIFGHNHKQRSLVRQGSHTSWNLAEFDFSNVPLNDFVDSSSPTAANEVQRITLGGTKSGAFSLLVDNAYVAGDIFYTSNGAAMADAIEKALKVGLTGGRVGRAVPPNQRSMTMSATIRLATQSPYSGASRIQGLTANGISVAYVSPDVFDVTFSAESTQPWQLIRLGSTTDGITVTTSRTSTGSSRREPVISATRGWPSAACFYGGRLILAGLKNKPTAFLGSVTNDLYNLGLGDSYDDEGIYTVLDTDQVNAIQSVMPGRRLELFSTGGEHAVLDDVLTPELTAPLQTEWGSSTVRPVRIDGSSIFIQRRGKQVRQLSYDLLKESFISQNLSALTPELFNSPVDMAALKGTARDDSNYVYIINGDGTMAVLLLSAEYEIVAWVPWSTDGEIQSVAVLDDEVYLLVKRTISAVDRYYIEILDEDVFMDSQTTVTLASPGKTVTGLSHLEGKTVQVKADGARRVDASVAGGSITLERDATVVEVGLPFEASAETMPPAFPTKTGTTLGDLKRIVKVQVQVLETAGISINGSQQTLRELDRDNLDTVPSAFTGFHDYSPGNSYWQTGPTVTITHNEPEAMTILGIIVEHEIGG
tara:strand:- start:144 stop:2288 length:2145 start_codon:yes stop_codon:yes gene_type:complete